MKPLDRLRPQLGPDVPYEQLSRAQKQARRAAGESKVRPFPDGRLRGRHGGVVYREKDIHASPKRALRTMLRLYLAAEKSNDRTRALRNSKAKIREARRG